MTANGTANSAPAVLTALLDLLQRGWRLMGRLLVGGLFILGAGIVALATAFIGVLLAFAALILRFTRGGNTARHRAPQHNKTNGDGFTLEARRTARGWTVE